jgi:hypothetical protein
MADRHDDLDAWLSERIEPLPPPPGTFELIKRRARRRKYRRLAITATAAAVIVAAAVTVPQVVNLPVLSPSGTSGVQAGHSSSAPPTGGGSPASSSARSTGPTVAPGPVPANFRPTSVTFVGAGTGFVIGQAGTPGHCATAYCTSVARTDDAGKTWTGVPAPLTGAPDGATGVSQVRFLNTDDGWAFGPELFATHDGGQTWTAVNTHGLRVTDLEAVGNRAFGVFASCGGSASAFAAQCTSFTLYSSPASGTDWTPVGASTSGLTDGGQDGAASLVLTGTRGYLLAPDRMLYAGLVSGGSPWQPVSHVPCVFGPVPPTGQSAGALLAAVNATNLVFACLPPAVPGPLPGGAQKKLIFSSADGGSSWLQVGVAPAAGIASSLAASPAQTVVLGTNQGVDLLPAGSRAWQTATLAGSVPAGGFSYVGMTTHYQGIALPADPASGTVWFTFDGGHSWQPSHLDGS